LPLAHDEWLALMQDSLDGLAVELGLLVATALLEDEVARLCGRRASRSVQAQYPANRQARRPGAMGLVGATETREGSLMGQESEPDPDRIRRCVGQSSVDRGRGGTSGRISH
jgi:hypothetical protein